MDISRRNLLAAASALAVTASLANAPARAEGVDQVKLLVPGPLGDKIVGDADAPVTIVEYASLTCGHCANFHEKTWPALKADYIETGKVRFIMREYPLNDPAFALAVVARSAPADKYFDIIDIMFEQLRGGGFSGNFLEALTKLSKQIGFTQDSFEAALTNQKLLDALVQEKARATNDFGVESTPTFFVNGEMHPGAMSIETLGKIIEDLL